MRAGKRHGVAPLRFALALALAAAAPYALADYRSSYAEGLKAAGDGDWAKVDAKMREALGENGKPLARDRLYGQVFRPYVPQFFLGIAAAKRGDCTAAVQNLEHGPTRAIVDDARAQRDLAEFMGAAQSGLEECRRRLAEAQRPTPTPIPSPPAPTPKPTTPTTPTGPETRTAADVVPPRPTPGPQPTPAPKPALPTPAPKPKPAVPTPTPAPAPAPAPAALTQALDHYVAGRYAQAAQIDPAQLGESRARYHALLVRAAARHVMAQLPGGDAAQLLAQVQADIRAAKTLQPGQRPDEALYSPRFRQLYADTR